MARSQERPVQVRFLDRRGQDHPYTYAYDAYGYPEIEVGDIVGVDNPLHGAVAKAVVIRFGRGEWTGKIKRIKGLYKLDERTFRIDNDAVTVSPQEDINDQITRLLEILTRRINKIETLTVDENLRIDKIYRKLSKRMDKIDARSFETQLTDDEKWVEEP